MENNYQYEIDVTYGVVMPVGEGGAPIEVEKTETVKVLYLKRTNIHHSRLAMMLTGDHVMDRIPEIAEKFVECAVDSPAKKDIQKDLFACLNIFNNPKVQEDLDNFLLKLDFVRALSPSDQTQPEP